MATFSETDYPFLVTKQFNKDLRLLEPKIQKQIVAKLQEISHHPDPVSLAKILTHFERGQYRWRIGPYRVTFDLKHDQIQLLTVRHRKEVYR